MHALLWQFALVLPLDQFFNNQRAIKRETEEHNKLRYGEKTITEHQWINASLVLSTALPRTTSSVLTPVSIEDLSDAVAEHVAVATGLMIDTHLLKEHIAPLCQLIEPSEFLAITLCRCSIMSEVLGDGLSKYLRGSMHSREHGSCADAQHTLPQQTLLQELVETRQSLTRLRAAAQSGFVGHFDGDMSLQTFVQRKSKDELLSKNDLRAQLRTATLEWAIDSNIAFANCPGSIVKVERLIRTMTTGRDSTVSNVMDKLVGRMTIGRHALILDSALDLMQKDIIDKVLCVYVCLIPDQKAHTHPVCTHISQPSCT